MHHRDCCDLGICHGDDGASGSGTADNCAKVLRTSAPDVAAVVILSFLVAWNDCLVANIFLSQEDLMAEPVGIRPFILQLAA